MICYFDRKNKKSIDVFQDSRSGDLIMYIKIKHIRCKVRCSFVTEQAVICNSYKNRKYTPQEFEQIRLLLSERFDFILVK